MVRPQSWRVPVLASAVWFVGAWPGLAAPPQPGTARADSASASVGAATRVETPADAPPDTAPVPADYDGVLREVGTRYPDLDRLEAIEKSLRHEAQARGVLPDPVLFVNLSNIPLSTDQTPLSGLQVDLRQTIPGPGKLHERRRVVEAQTRVTESQRAEAANRAVRIAREALWELAFLAAQRAVALDIRKTLEHLAEVAGATYEVGRGRQQDLIRPVVEMHRVDETIVRIDRRMEQLRSAINALRDRPADAPIEVPRLDLGAAVGIDVDEEALWREASERNPLLAARRRAVAKARAAVALARANRWPDFTVGLQYRVRWADTNDPVHGADFVGVVVGANLPVYMGLKQNRRIDAALAEVRAARAALHAAEVSLRDELTKAVAALRMHHDEERIWKDRVIPDVRKALESAQSDYQAGRLEFITVLDNLMQLFRARVEAYRHAALARQTLAKIDWIRGLPHSEAAGEHGGKAR